MNLMPCRLISLIQTLQGYQKTGIPLIAFDGKKLSPIFTADDLGIYVIIPKIATFLNLSIEQAIHVFFYSILIIPFIIGFLGFFKLYQSTAQRIIASIWLVLLALFAARIGDVYLAYAACTVSLIPWCLYFVKKGHFSNSFLFYGFLSGFLISFFHYIRAYSSLGTLLFIMIVLGFSHVFSLKQKTLVGMFFIIGMIIPITYFNHAYNEYKTYATAHFPESSLIMKKHVLWHNTYMGFSFLNFKNPDNIHYGDSFTDAKAKSINPGVISNSPEYEETLKQEIIRLIKNYPVFIIWTLFAKIGILFLFLLIFANGGLIAAFVYSKPWYIEGAFWSSLLFNSIFPLLAIPISEYSLGFIATAALYGIVSINNALEKNSL